MKKLWIAIFLVLLISVSCVFAGCSKNDNFGAFGQGGHYLKAMAKKNINYSAAVNKVKSNVSAFVPVYGADTDPVGNSVPKPSETLVQRLDNLYSELRIVVRYYDDKNKLQEIGGTENIIMGNRLKEVFAQNYVDTSIGLRVSNIIMHEELLNYMDAANKAFNSEGIPFKEPYTYHIDSNNEKKSNLVIQMHEYAEMGSVGINGGITCYFRQDTEVLYDAQNKITKWQTSLGMVRANQGGMVREGYIYEVELTWIEKA